MRSAELARRAEAVPGLVVAPVLVAAQLAVAAAIAAGADWRASTGEWARGAVLLAAAVLLLYAVGRSIGGRLLGAGAALLWIVAPPFLLATYWRVGGNPSTDFTDAFHEAVLPVAFGVERAAPLLAGCLLLAAAWLALARPVPALAAGALAGASAGAAALVHPRAWPAVAAPALALAWSRRPFSALAAATTALVALGALALFRDVPGISLDPHGIGFSLSSVREYSWSARLLEYLPLAGLVGLARRSPAAAILFGWLFLTLVVMELARKLDLFHLLPAVVPGLPVYVLLTACIPYLVPRRRPADAPAADVSLV